MSTSRKLVWTMFAALLLWGTPVSAEETTTSISDELKDQRHLFELGLFLGGFFPHSEHQFYDLDRPTFDYSPLNNAFEIGLRAGYLPLPFLGAEFEAALMPGSTEAGGTATLFSIRAHLLAQYPARLAPFVVAGMNSIGVISDDPVLGNDIDLAPYFGVGAKFYATRWMVLRLDGRLDVGASKLATSHVAHFEVLAGASFVLGWKEPEPPPKEEPVEEPMPKDSDNDGINDDQDKCPTEPGIPPDG